MVLSVAIFAFFTLLLAQKSQKGEIWAKKVSPQGGDVQKMNIDAKSGAFCIYFHGPSFISENIPLYGDDNMSPPGAEFP